LASAGDFDFQPEVTGAERLEKGKGDPKKVPRLLESPADWPTFRADNTCSATTKAVVPQSAKLLWRFEPNVKISSSSIPPTAPVAAGGLIFTSGPDGIVRAVHAATGKLRWKAYTGGAIRMPPTVWEGRVFVGSGDGWVYSFRARNGRLIWRFRVAPAERKIPVYGAISSTWPAAGGVLVADGVAYVAAGIVNYDGTYVYALANSTSRAATRFRPRSTMRRTENASMIPIWSRESRRTTSS